MADSALHYDAGGGGPPLLLIHGHPFDRRMWEPQLRGLSDAFRVVAPDLPGYGRSPRTEGTVPMRRLADAVLALIGDLGLGRPVVAGLSMGGLVAMELVIAHPERIAGVALCATTAQPVTDEEARRRRASADEMEAEGMLRVTLEMAGRLFGPRARRDPDLVSFVVDMMLHAPPSGAAAAVRGRAERPDYRPLLRGLTVPALVVAGDSDPYAPEPVVEELVGALRSPTVFRLPGVGHLPNLEAPEAFNAALRSFAAEALDRPASTPTTTPTKGAG
jgi:3-oxoadipate enol-lactonase